MNTDRGFTLLEVVVAIAILAAVLTTGMELLAVGLRSAKAAKDYTQAMLLARRTLDEISLQPLGPRVVDGSAGAYRWRAEITPEPQEDENAPAQLYKLHLRVAWPGRAGEKATELVTLRARVEEEKLPVTLPARGAGGEPKDPAPRVPPVPAPGGKR